MKRLLKAACLTAIAGALLSGSMTAFAGQWQQDEKGWWYQNDDGSYLANTSEWIDGNQDGIAECYFFDADGYMLANTTGPMNEEINADGAWVYQGVVQTKSVVTDAVKNAGISQYVGTYHYARLLTPFGAEEKDQPSEKAFITEQDGQLYIQGELGEFMSDVLPGIAAPVKLTRDDEFSDSEQQEYFYYVRDYGTGTANHYVILYPDKIEFQGNNEYLVFVKD